MLFGIRLRLAVLALALTAPTVGYEVWASTQNRQRAIAGAATRVEELAKLSAAEEDDSLQEASNLLRVLKHVSAIINPAPEECHELLRGITNEHPRIELISVTRPDGSVACTSAQPVPPSFSVADRAWFRDATAVDAPAVVMSELLISRAKGLPGVVVASGLSAPGSVGTRGAISALMNLEWFSDVATKLSASTGATVKIVDLRAGTVIAKSSAADDLPERPSISAEILEALKGSSQGTMEVEDPAGDAEIVGYRWLPGDQGSHSAVVVSMKKSTVVADANDQLIYATVTSGAALLCGLLLAWCAAEVSIIRPLSALARMATRFGGGDLEARVKFQRCGVFELQVLGDILNRAVEQVQVRDSELEQLTLRDPLTGLANRRCFDKALDREWVRAERTNAPIALLMVDVDFFKRYNDTYGHLAGDECLRRLATAIAARARSAFDVIARYGGEEIALLIPSIDVASAIDMAERLVQEVRELELPHSGSPLLWVSVSVGLAIVEPKGRTAVPRSLIEAADRALYEAKRTGRNRVAYANERTSAETMAEAVEL